MNFDSPPAEACEHAADHVGDDIPDIPGRAVDEVGSDGFANDGPHHNMETNFTRSGRRIVEPEPQPALNEQDGR